MYLEHKNCQEGFTLTELLVVVGLMAVLSAIAITGMKTLSQGAELRGAARQVQSTLSLARQYAVTHNTTVRFIIASDNAPYSGNADKCLRAYAVYNFGRSESSQTDDSYVKEWTYLPDGVVFNTFTNTVVSDQISYANLLGQNPYTTSIRFPFISSASSRIFHGVTFTPDGKSRNQNNENIAIVLSEGSTTWPKTGNVTPDVSLSAQYLIFPQGGSKAVVLNKNQGRSKVVDL